MADQGWCGSQQADAEVRLAGKEIEAAERLVPAMPGIDRALVKCLRGGLFVNMLVGGTLSSWVLPSLSGAWLLQLKSWHASIGKVTSLNWSALMGLTRLAWPCDACRLNNRHKMQQSKQNVAMMQQQVRTAENWLRRQQVGGAGVNVVY